MLNQYYLILFLIVLILFLSRRHTEGFLVGGGRIPTGYYRFVVIRPVCTVDSSGIINSTENEPICERYLSKDLYLGGPPFHWYLKNIGEDTYKMSNETDTMDVEIKAISYGQVNYYEIVKDGKVLSVATSVMGLDQGSVGQAKPEAFFAERNTGPLPLHFRLEVNDSTDFDYPKVDPVLPWVHGWTHQKLSEKTKEGKDLYRLSGPYGCLCHGWWDHSCQYGKKNDCKWVLRNDGKFQNYHYGILKNRPNMCICHTNDPKDKFGPWKYVNCMTDCDVIPPKLPEGWSYDKKSSHIKGPYGCLCQGWWDHSCQYGNKDDCKWVLRNDGKFENYHYGILQEKTNSCLCPGGADPESKTGPWQHGQDCTKMCPTEESLLAKAYYEKWKKYNSYWTSEQENVRDWIRNAMKNLITTKHGQRKGSNIFEYLAELFGGI